MLELKVKGKGSYKYNLNVGESSYKVIEYKGVNLARLLGWYLIIESPI